MERIYSDSQIGDVVFRKRKGCRRVSIRVHPVKGVSVTVPYMVPYMAALAFFRLKRDWVLETIIRQKEKYKELTPANPLEVEALRRQAKKELPVRLAELARRYGFSYNRVAIKHNSSNWGSCSARNNINLNLNIVRLPKVLQDYVLLHELCHLRHHDHVQSPQSSGTPDVRSLVRLSHALICAYIFQNLSDDLMVFSIFSKFVNLC